MKKIYHEGDIFTSTYGTKVILVKRLDYKRCIVQVYGTSVEFLTHLTLLPSGKFKTPYCKTVLGVGYLGAIETSSVKHLPSYSIWTNMLKRCYTNYRGNVSPLAYAGVLVADDWHNFSTFNSWYSKKADVFDGTGVVPKLDKDLLSNGVGLYSCDTCCLLPHSINCAIIESKKGGDLPMGVVRNRGKYAARIMVESNLITVGSFVKLEDASSAYAAAKIRVVQELAGKYRYVLEPHVYKRLMQWTPENYITKGENIE